MSDYYSFALCPQLCQLGGTAKVLREYCRLDGGLAHPLPHAPLNASVPERIEGLTVRTLIPAVLYRKSKPLHPNREPFRVPTSGAKWRRITFHPIKAISQDELFAELERPL